MSRLFFRNPLQIFVNYDKIENEISAPLCVLSDFVRDPGIFPVFDSISVLKAVCLRI